MGHTPHPKPAGGDSTGSGGGSHSGVTGTAAGAGTPAGNSGTPAAAAAAPAPDLETPSPAGGEAPGGGEAQELIDVDFDLLTSDQKRKVNFRLTKALQGGDILWTINFSLFERTDTTKAFSTDPNVHLAVTVDKTANDKAEAAAKNGLTPAQAAQATGPTSIVVKAAAANPTLKPLAQEEVQKVVKT